MKIMDLTVRYFNKKRHFKFSPNTSLIYSRDNSVGKSTLLRIIFYSLGYSIPGTQKVKFDKLKTEIELFTRGERIILSRNDKKMDIALGKENLSFVLPEQHEEVLQVLFDNKNLNILKNILGAIYMDQDKGWTLLNRGIVIGNIRFNIEDLIAGLAEVDISQENKLLDIYSQQLKKYKGLRDISNYQVEFGDSDIISNNSEVDKLIDRIAVLASKKEIVKRKILDLNKTLKNNSSFISQLEKLEIQVVAPKSKEIVSVNKSTIEGYDDNVNFLKMRKWSLKEECAKLESEIEKLQHKRLELQGQLDLFNEKDSLGKANQLLQTVKIDSAVVEAQIEILNSRLKDIKKQKQLKLDNQSKVVSYMSDLVIEYASKLNVDQFLQQTDNFLFVNKLRDLSGTVLHKLVFCFKLSYIKAIERYLGLKLPIVLDSPSGREITADNIHDMFELLNEHFEGNQKIIATIYEDIVKYDKIIELNSTNKLFE